MTDHKLEERTGSFAARLASLTPARVGLGRTGASLTTREVLRFQLAHTRARDAVHVALDAGALAAGIAALGQTVERVETAATRRELYLRRPDLGRKLTAESAERVERLRCDGLDVSIVIADGLSSQAVASHAVPLLARLLPKIEQLGLKLAPLVIAEGARVALGDEVGLRLGARLVLVLIGERPGLSSPDSLGAYITYAPRLERTDAERNCVSNIRPDGLGVETASFKIAWLIAAAVAAGMSGVQLKDESDKRDLLQRPQGFDNVEAGEPH